MKKLISFLLAVALFPAIVLAQNGSVITANGNNRTLDAPLGGGITLSLAGTKVFRASGNLAKVGTIASGLTATGSTIADALLLNANHNVFTTVAAGTGALLPSSGPSAQLEVTVYNRGLNQLSVYPQSGGVIGSAATSAAVFIQPGRSATFKSGVTQDVWSTDILFPALTETQTVNTALTTPIPQTALRVIVTAVPTAGTGRVQLPVCSPGQTFYVQNKNATGASVGILPSTGGQIDAVGVDTSYTLAGGKSASFFCSTGLQLFSFLSA